MPQNRFENQTGEQILAGLKNHLATTSQKLHGHVGRDDIPAPYRRRIRDESINDIRAATDEARQAFAAWSQREVQSARQTLAADEIGTQAEETAKLRREAIIQRLITTAQLTDQRSGSQMRGGRPVTNPSAWDLAAEAQRLFSETSNYEEALVRSEAAIALGAGQAVKVRDAAQEMIWSQDPSKRNAMKDLDKVERAQAVFVRDTSAALAHVYQAAAAEAKDLNDDPSGFLKAAVGPSMAAKAAALAVANRDGTDYVEPIGTLPSGPTGGNARTPDRQSSLVDSHR